MIFRDDANDFPCSNCTKKFNSNNDRNTHERNCLFVSTPCDLCENSIDFLFYNSLSTHKRKHYCRICRKFFKHVELCEVHEFDHIDQACQFCATSMGENIDEIVQHAKDCKTRPTDREIDHELFLAQSDVFKQALIKHPHLEKNPEYKNYMASKLIERNANREPVLASNGMPHWRQDLFAPLEDNSVIVGNNPNLLRLGTTGRVYFDVKR